MRHKYDGTIPECWTDDPTYARPRRNGFWVWGQRWAIRRIRHFLGWFKYE